MGLVTTNFKIGALSVPGAYARFRFGEQDFRDYGNMRAQLNVQMWMSKADYDAAQGTPAVEANPNATPPVVGSPAVPPDTTKIPIDIGERYIQITNQTDLAAILTGRGIDPNWPVPLADDGKPIGGLTFLAAYAIRNMPEWAGTWE